MKAFRGTLVALLVLGALLVAVRLARPELFAGGEEEEGPPQIFSFEKQELVRVQVDRPDGSRVVLAEKDGRWVIEGTGWPAGRSMVNRVKHQIHDLAARATVGEDPELPELYGLGKNAIRVTLTMRDGREIAFEAGDPNPTGVSYYIRPLPDGPIYTVKKAAVDYYGLTLEDFRERRFASFDSKDAVAYDARLRLDGAPPRLAFELGDDGRWHMLAPREMDASTDQVRRLLGRVAALKAQDFVVVEEGRLQEALDSHGLDPPRADVTIRFSSREPLHLLVGADAPSSNRFEELAYFHIEGENTIYVARRGLLDEFRRDLQEFRDRRVVRMEPSDVVAVDVWMRAEEQGDPEGEHGVRYVAEQWVWKDGVPVPGSTPERVARALATLEVDAFVDDHPRSDAAYGLDDPVARAVLTDARGNERVVLVGKRGEPDRDPEGREIPRRYVRIEGEPPVYLVHERVLRVMRDLVREGNRKAKRDAERAARLERIPTVDPEAAEEEEP